MLCSKCAANLPDDAQFCLKCGQAIPSPASFNPSSTVNVGVGCAKCGASLPQGAQFCLKCGNPVSLPPKDGPAVEVIPPATPLPRRKRRWALWISLLLCVVVVLWIASSDNPFAQGAQEMAGWKHDQTILDSYFTVGPHTFRDYKFSLPEGSVNVAVVGQFSAENEKRDSKESDKDQTGIEVYVLTESAFTIWQRGYATSSVYESGRVSQGTVQADLPAGAGVYYLVFSNKFATKGSKNVSASVLLRYKSWLPESLRRMKDRFWNWIGV